MPVDRRPLSCAVVAVLTAADAIGRLGGEPVEPWRLAVDQCSSSGRYVLREASEMRTTFVENIDAGLRARRWHEDQFAEALPE